MELYRSRNGKVFHLPDCGVSGERNEWLWARPFTYLQVLEGIHGLGVHPCKTCLPPHRTPPEE